MTRLFCLFLLAPFISGCATAGDTVDANYNARLQTQVSIEQAQVNVEIARHNADAARWAALARIAESGDSHTRQMAVLALALGGQQGVILPRQAQQLPALPETDADKAYKWAALFAGPITNIASGWFGYKLGTTQSNNAAVTTLGAYDTFGRISTVGYAAVAGTATQGYNTLGGVAGLIQAPQANNIFSVGGNGVVGAGTYATTDITNSQNRTCTGGAANGTTTPTGGYASGC